MTKERIERIEGIIEYHECHHGVPSAVYASEFNNLAKAIDELVEGEIEEYKKEVADLKSEIEKINEKYPLYSLDENGKMEKLDYIPKHKLKPILDVYEKYNHYDGNDPEFWYDYKEDMWQAIKSLAEEINEENILE